MVGDDIANVDTQALSSSPGVEKGSLDGSSDGIIRAGAWCKAEDANSIEDAVSEQERESHGITMTTTVEVHSQSVY